MNPYILKDNMRCLLRYNLFFTWHKNIHFDEPIYNNIQVIMTFPWHWKTTYKIHWDTLPMMWRNQKWRVESKFPITRLTYCTQRTYSNKTRYTINHVWPITIPLEIHYCLAYTKVYRNQWSVCLPYDIISFSLWYTWLSQVMHFMHMII